MRDWRERTHSFTGCLIPRSAVKLTFFGARDIGGAVIAEPIRNARPSDGRSESIGLRYDPIGQESAVGIAGDAQALAIQRIVFQSVIHARHHVLIIQLAPSSPRRPQEFLSVASG